MTSTPTRTPGRPTVIPAQPGGSEPLLLDGKPAQWVAASQLRGGDIIARPKPQQHDRPAAAVRLESVHLTPDRVRAKTHGQDKWYEWSPGEPVLRRLHPDKP